jgi:hypothetical protein
MIATIAKRQDDGRDKRPEDERQDKQGNQDAEHPPVWDRSAMSSRNPAHAGVAGDQHLSHFCRAA